MARRETWNVGKLITNGASNGTVDVRQEDESEKALLCTGTAIPADASAGYALGCKLIRTDAVLGMHREFINVGTAASCKFRGVGPTTGYGIHAAGKFTTAGGDTTETISSPTAITSLDISLVGHHTSDDTDNIVGQVVGNQVITVTGSADPSTAHGYNWALLRNGITPAWDIVYAGTHTTVGGAAAEAITLTGLLATDIALVGYGATDDTDTIAKAVCTANTLTVTMSANPSTTHSIHYAILRPAGLSRASHYIAYAGNPTTGGGGAAEAITVTGAAATDIPIVCYGTTNDTDTILKSVMTANTLTVTCSADPSTAHSLSYMILRAY